ncbi:MAG: TlyA family RNA methyltransferase [Fervidobacterium sp.]|uniref:TlyA family RNA methyltransferase n=1 Tax=Fervidobacterium sp. TaxID=1871331 RepID=UPI00404AADD2
MGTDIKKIRLDVALFQKGLTESRTKARQIIENGNVMVNGKVCTDPSKLILESDAIAVLEELKYVSRAGYKLEGLFNEFSLEIRDKVACDIGSSTGGFTDFLLQLGAKRVYTVDVNTKQLHPKVATDPRVVKIEKNARDLEISDLGEKVDLITVDVSFISITKLLKPIKSILNSDGRAIILIKPQFELGHRHTGVIRKKELHISILENIIDAFFQEKLFIDYLTYSKILGGDGNIEFFLVAGNGDKKIGKYELIKESVIKVVNNAWEEHYRCSQ